VRVRGGARAIRSQDGGAVNPAGLPLEGRSLQNGSPLTAAAFERGLSHLFDGGRFLVALSVFLFAISTAISWSYYGDRAIQYLVGDRAVLPYRLVFVVMHFVGAIFSLEMVWGFGDVALALMALPNLIAILALSRRVKVMQQEYFGRMR
jgi:AGCS family alanine or glycine:cation symporter